MIHFPYQVSDPVTPVRPGRTFLETEKCREQIRTVTKFISKFLKKPGHFSCVFNNNRPFTAPEDAVSFENFFLFTHSGSRKKENHMILLL